MLIRNIVARAVFICLLPFSAMAHENMVGDVMIGHPWARATVGESSNGAAYLTLTNTGNGVDSLVSASTPVAEKAELHTHLVENGVMKMRPVDGINIAPNSTIELNPGGLHIMLMGVKAPLKEGATFPLTLTFQKAGTISVLVLVESASQMGSGHEAHHMH
jgi:hypothetical protein